MFNIQMAGGGMLFANTESTKYVTRDIPICTYFTNSTARMLQGFAYIHGEEVATNIDFHALLCAEYVFQALLQGIMMACIRYNGLVTD